MSELSGAKIVHSSKLSLNMIEAICKSIDSSVMVNFGNCKIDEDYAPINHIDVFNNLRYSSGSCFDIPNTDFLCAINAGLDLGPAVGIEESTIFSPITSRPVIINFVKYDMLMSTEIYIEKETLRSQNPSNTAISPHMRNWSYFMNLISSVTLSIPSTFVCLENGITSFSEDHYIN